MRACVVGGGLAGSLLAWRLAQRLDVHVDLVLGRHQDADATQASGGAVRAYEPSAQARRLAIASLRELLGSRVLLQWSDYRQTGFVYLRETDAGLAAEAEEIDRELPGSVELLPASPAAGSRSLGWSRFPGRIAVLERQAGYISPAELRRAILTDLAGRPGATVRAAVLDALEPTGTGDTARATVDGSVHEYDVIVLAVGAWTHDLLRANGRRGRGYRTKSIQYTIYAAGAWRPPSFADEISGLYGRPTADGGLLLGVPTAEWDVGPGRTPVTPACHRRAAELAAGFFAELQLGQVRSVTSAADCYCDPPILRLRGLADAAPCLLTFTGGSGGSVKTVLAASRLAAAQLVESAVPQAEPQAELLTAPGTDTAAEHVGTALAGSEIVHDDAP